MVGDLSSRHHSSLKTPRNDEAADRQMLQKVVEERFHGIFDFCMRMDALLRGLLAGSVGAVDQMKEDSVQEQEQREET